MFFLLGDRRRYAVLLKASSAEHPAVFVDVCVTADIFEYGQGLGKLGR
jgi:hypothetical protein